MSGIYYVLNADMAKDFIKSNEGRLSEQQKKIINSEMKDGESYFCKHKPESGSKQIYCVTSTNPQGKFALNVVIETIDVGKKIITPSGEVQINIDEEESCKA